VDPDKIQSACGSCWNNFDLSLNLRIIERKDGGEEEKRRGEKKRERGGEREPQLVRLCVSTYKDRLIPPVYPSSGYSF